MAKLSEEQRFAAHAACTVLLVFSDERQREAWLEEHGFVPPKHGEYTGVAARVDYEHRRGSQSLVFGVWRGETEHAPGPEWVAPEPQQAEDRIHRIHRAPEDGKLPFKGKYEGVLLSALGTDDLRAIQVALARALNDNPGQSADMLKQWIGRVQAWDDFRTKVPVDTKELP